MPGHSFVHPNLKPQRLAAEREIHPKYVRHLLTAFGSVEGEASVKAQPLIEPLSDRELEVLRYLASGLSNQAICADARRLANASQTQQRFAIADKLFVSLATAKWHARNIYGKLNASNRTQAVAQARELGILK